jgi:hypothetical protein
VFGGPAGGIAALPGGGFIDFVPAAPTRTLLFTSPDGSHWSQTGKISGEDATGITGPVATNGRVYVALGGEGGGTSYGGQSNGATSVSSDLRSWTKAPVQEAFGGAEFGDVAAGPAGFVATGFDQGGRTIWSATRVADPVRIDTGLHRGWTALTADASRIVWGQVATDTDQPAPITVWDIGSGQITTIPTAIDVMRVWLTPGGWLAWAGDGLDAAGQKIERGYAVRITGP